VSVAGSLPAPRSARHVGQSSGSSSGLKSRNLPRFDSKNPSLPLVLQPEDLPLLRKVRRKRVTFQSDEALEDYAMHTSLVWVLTWKPELVAGDKGPSGDKNEKE
jgi:hypothetical protein